MNKAGDRLEARLPTRLGFGVLLLLILLAGYKLRVPYPYRLGVPGEPVSLFGKLSPRGTWMNPHIYQAGILGFLVGSFLWLLRIGIPWTSWIAVTSFWVATSSFVEGLVQGADHTRHVLVPLLVLHAAWTHFAAPQIREADRRGQLFRSHLYFGWTYEFSVFSLAWFYFLAGFSKLTESGFGWCQGTNLQLWVAMFGDPSFFGCQWILASRTLAQVFQVSVLSLELGSILALPWAQLRPWIGLALLGFQIGNEFVFHFSFEVQAVLVGIFFLPGDQIFRTQLRRA